MSSIIEHLDPDVQIPWDEEALLSGDPVRVSEYLLELVKTLQGLLEKMTRASNYIIDTVPGEAIYSKLKDASGDYPVGTWRLIQVGDIWQRQVQLVLGVWTRAGDFEIPV